MTDLVDWNKVTELRDEIGGEDFDEVVELFLDEVEEVITALGASDRNLEHDLHFLKGSALNLGFSLFSSLCQNGEEACAAGQSDSVDVAEVKSCYSDSKASFLSDLKARLAA